LNVARTDCFPLSSNMVEPGNWSSIFDMTASFSECIINFISFKIVMKIYYNSNFTIKQSYDQWEILKMTEK